MDSGWIRGGFGVDSGWIRGGFGWIRGGFGVDSGWIRVVPCFSTYGEKIQKSFYAIICDEYTDISNKGQLTFCLRWVDDCFRVREEFFG